MSTEYDDRLADAGPAPRVVIEATDGRYWAVEALQDAGAEVHPAHLPNVKMFHLLVDVAETGVAVRVPLALDGLGGTLQAEAR